MSLCTVKYIGGAPHIDGNIDKVMPERMAVCGATGEIMIYTERPYFKGLYSLKREGTDYVATFIKHLK